MHGRVKVRTTEEERERKKKEQALKVKAYRAATTVIQAKRQRKEYDEDLLKITSQILLRNPDTGTLWNVRRETIEHMTKEILSAVDSASIKQEDGEVSSKDGDDIERREEDSKLKQLQVLYERELTLSENCLLANPKSYGAWHHRCWALENCPQANWENEVQLCNKYLKLDERNFHTWDYRRYVTGKAGVSKMDELNFCTEKIKVNFSNYSSWHHRSLLLPELYPYEGDAQPKRPMSEAKLKEELEMVLTAAFTDPNDSSAWFYQRWLLGYSRQELAVCAFRCDGHKAVLALTNPTPLKNVKVVLVDGSGNDLWEFCDWNAANQTASDTTWVAHCRHAEFDATQNYRLKLNIPEIERNPQQELPLTIYAGAPSPATTSLYYFNAPNRSFAFSAAVVGELQSQLESCESLLQFEPDSKWTLLTSALLMRAIDRELYHTQTLEYLQKLQTVDCLREGYYKDLASKWVLEKVLNDWSKSSDVPKKLSLLGQPQLTAICYGQYLTIADEVELSEKLLEIYAGRVKLKKFSDFEKIAE